MSAPKKLDALDRRGLVALCSCTWLLRTPSRNVIPIEAFESVEPCSVGKASHRRRQSSRPEGMSGVGPRPKRVGHLASNESGQAGSTARAVSAGPLELRGDARVVVRTVRLKWTDGHTIGLPGRPQAAFGCCAREACPQPVVKAQLPPEVDRSRQLRYTALHCSHGPESGR